MPRASRAALRHARAKRADCHQSSPTPTTCCCFNEANQAIQCQPCHLTFFSTLFMCSRNQAERSNACACICVDTYACVYVQVCTHIHVCTYRYVCIEKLKVSCKMKLRQMRRVTTRLTPHHHPHPDLSAPLAMRVKSNRCLSLVVCTVWADVHASKWFVSGKVKFVVALFHLSKDPHRPRRAHTRGPSPHVRSLLKTDGCGQANRKTVAAGQQRRVEVAASCSTAWLPQRSGRRARQATLPLHNTLRARRARCRVVSVHAPLA